jgi:hypothetical protein
MGRELRKTTRNGVEKWRVHETVSEAECPITPAFKTREELIEYLVTKGTAWDEPWSRKAAEHFVRHAGWAPSLILSKAGLTKGYEQPGELPDKGGGDGKPAREDDSD